MKSVWRQVSLPGGTRPESVSGFTLVELLVVIGILATPAALLLPALARAKARAQGIVCLNNLERFQLTWIPARAGLTKTIKP